MHFRIYFDSISQFTLTYTCTYINWWDFDCNYIESIDQFRGELISQHTWVGQTINVEYLAIYLSLFFFSIFLFFATTGKWNKYIIYNSIRRANTCDLLYEPAQQTLLSQSTSIWEDLWTSPVNTSCVNMLIYDYFIDKTLNLIHIWPSSRALTQYVNLAENCMSFQKNSRKVGNNVTAALFMIFLF